MSHRIYELPDDYSAGHNWERGQEHDDRTLFTITVEEHAWYFDDGIADPDRPCPSDEQVKQLGHNAGDAVWDEMWLDRLGLALGTACIVTVRGADGNVIRSMSK